MVLLKLRNRPHEVIYAEVRKIHHNKHWIKSWHQKFEMKKKPHYVT